MPKKTIEKVIVEVLKEDAQKLALDFIQHLREMKIPLEEASENYWEIKYRDECICFLWIDGSDQEPGPWTIWSAQVSGSWVSTEDHPCDDFPMDDEIKRIAWDNVNVCGSCGDCSHGTDKIVLGKKFENLCKSTLAFTNPDANELKCAKKMIDARIADIMKEKSISF